MEDPGPAGLNLPTVDLMAISSKYLETLDLVAEARNVTREKTLATERKKKGVKKSLMETKTLHNKNIISNFKAGGSVSIRGRGFSRSSFRPDPFRARPPNTSRPPSLHVDDFLVLELKGQQPTGPTGYNKQSIKAAKELFAARDAENALKPPAQLREATREPVVPYNRGRGRGERGGGEEAFEGAMGRPIGTSTEGTAGDGVLRGQEAFRGQENQETWEERLGLDLGKMGEGEEAETEADSEEVVVIDEVAVLGAGIVVEVEENGGLEEEAVEVEIEMTEFAIFVP